MLIPVILSGGAGTRLWPVSREFHPKPFICLQDGKSLLQKAFLRAVSLPGVNEVLTVTNRELYFKTKDEYQAVNPGGLSTAFILEPFGRNTAPAVALAASYVAETYGHDSVLLVLPADHLVEDQTAFSEAVGQAYQLAQDGYLVTFGIRPSGPETGYGYIEANGHAVRRFVEKPSPESARAFVSSGRYYWNSGMFCFQVDTTLQEMRSHCPEVIEMAQRCLGASRTARGERLSVIELEPVMFEALPSVSIDYALMEKSEKVAVVACDIGWSDVGSWGALSVLAEADENGNSATGEVVLHDTRNCYIQNDERIVGAVGVENLIIIDTPDALLVVDKTRTQDVRHIYAKLKAQGHEAHKLHRTVHRPWGTYTVLEEGSRFKIKRIVVKPGASLSLQMHRHRSEHWVVVSGTVTVINDDKKTIVRHNESTYIPVGHRHRLENPGATDCVIIEVQCGEYVGEDDIVRFDDVYGRTTR